MNRKQIFSKRIYLNMPMSLAAITVASALFFLAAMYAQPGPFSDALKNLNESGVWIYIMNWLPILFCAGVLFFLLNHCALAVSITGAIFGMLSVANYLKIKMRQSPLFPWDLSLGGEVLGIARSFPASLLFLLMAMLIGMIAFIVLLAFFVRNKLLVTWVRIAGVLFILLSTWLLSGLYADKSLYDAAYVSGSPYNEVDKFNARGFVYSFLHVLASTKIERPPGYDRQSAADYLAERETDITHLVSQQKPHIIVIMSEAFSDLSLCADLNFNGYIDPIAHFSELQKVSLSGSVVTPNIGGGTADTEFDVLTGINTRHYRGVPYTFNLVNKPIPSLASALARIGYQSVMIHPGPGWFYDRANVYEHMGFDRLIFLPEFEGARNVGGYVSETDTIDKIISEYEAHISSSNAPLFKFCITIQNHGPYLDKYAAPKSPPTPKNFETALPMSDTQLNTLYNYFHGLADSDRELQRLAEYFEARSEPVVLLYFGDHLPSLDYDVYNAILPPGEPGKISGETKLYRTPYMIWRNAAAAGLVDLTENIPSAETVSTQYLGAILLQALGYEGLCPYFDFIAQLSESYPVVLETRYADMHGVVYEGDEPEPLALLRKLAYYRFFSE